MKQQRFCDAILSKLQAWNGRRARFRCDKHRDNSHSVAALVKILEVECVVPNLLNSADTEFRSTHLELNDKDYRSRQHYGVDAPPHARNVEFQEDRPIDPVKPLLE